MFLLYFGCFLSFLAQTWLLLTCFGAAELFKVKQPCWAQLNVRRDASDARGREDTNTSVHTKHTESHPTSVWITVRRLRASRHLSLRKRFILKAVKWCLVKGLSFLWDAVCMWFTALSDSSESWEDRLCSGYISRPLSSSQSSLVQIKNKKRTFSLHVSKSATNQWHILT